MKRLIAGLLVFCVCGFTPAQAAPKPPKSDVALCEDLLSKDEEVRDKAVEALSESRGTVINSLLAKLDAVIKTPDRAFGGPFHQVVLVLADWRVTPAAGRLSDIVETRLTGHPPNGAFGGPQVYYPVASALVEIGGPNFNQYLFDRMVHTANEDLIRVTTWALLQRNSKPVLRFMIQNERDDVTRVLKLIGVTDTNPEKRNLERMLQLLDSKELILPPENQPPADKPTPAR